MMAKSAVTGFTCWLALSVLTSAEALPIGTTSLEALQFFERFSSATPGDLLQALRPSPIGSNERARALALLPEKGELVPDKNERAKLSALDSILHSHDRQRILVLKVVDLPQAAVALYARAAIFISRPALRLLSVTELQAVVAHEIGHEYFWPEYEEARERRDRRGRQVLELKCDGIAVLTLLALGVDPAHVSGAMRKLTAFNERLGATANSDEYPSIGERMRFIKALLENRRS